MKQKAATDQETFAAVMVVMVVTVVVLAIGGVVVTCNLLFLVDFCWLCLIVFIVVLDMDLITSCVKAKSMDIESGYCMCICMYIYIYIYMCICICLSRIIYFCDLSESCSVLIHVDARWHALAKEDLFFGSSVPVQAEIPLDQV